MITYALGIVVILICSYTMMISAHTNIRAKAKMYIVSILCIGIILWPAIWKMMLKEYSSKHQSLPSLIWPICVLFLELYLLKYHTFEQHTKKNKSILAMDANAICSITFALSSVLGAHKNQTCKNMFMYGVLGCIAFVMPSPQAPLDTLESVLIENIQKIILIYATGSLLGASMLLIDDKKSPAVVNEE